MSDERDDEPPPREGTIPPPAGERYADRAGGEQERKRLFERAVPLIVKRVLERAVESGVEKLGELSEKPDELRSFVKDLRLPKEVLSEVYSQIDDTKTGLYRVVAKEIRDVLEHTQVADEIVKVLTKLSFEIKTEIRFVPNDRAADAKAEGEGKPDAEGKPSTAPGAEGSARSGSVRPKVTSEVTVRDRGRREEK